MSLVWNFVGKNLAMLSTDIRHGVIKLEIKCDAISCELKQLEKHTQKKTINVKYQLTISIQKFNVNLIYK